MVQPSALREGDETMVNRDAVNCERVWQEISNYLEGEVDAGVRAAMDEHFHSCAKCRSVLEGTRNVIRLYGDERMIEVPTGFGRRLEKRLARNVRESGKRWSSWSAWLVPVAALLLFAGGLRVASSSVVPPVKSPLAQAGRGIPPDMPVIVTADAKVFHVAGCGVIHNKETARTITAKEAMEQGYVPCLRCLRKYVETADTVGISLGGEDDLDADAEGELRGPGR